MHLLNLPTDINECAEDDHICAHNCHNSVGSHSCSCNAGYRLNPDGRNCDGESYVDMSSHMHSYHSYSHWLQSTDIDECTENSDGCEHQCTDTDGSFECSCRDGFRLGSDGRSCDGKWTAMKLHTICANSGSILIFSYIIQCKSNQYWRVFGL